MGAAADALTAQGIPLNSNYGRGVSLEMVRIPGGEFLMGAPEEEKGAYDEEKPQHRVTVPEFCLGKFPITQA